MDRNRKYGKAQQLAVSEIMTILIMFQITQYRNFKTYYNEFIKVYWHEYFPQAPSYNRFVELMSQAILPLSYFLTYHQGERTGIYYVDATKLPVCHNLREKNHKVFEENKLADDQQITHHPEYTEISATLKVSGEFVWWVLGFGAHLEVVEPKVLRESIIQHLKQMQMRYF